MRREKKYYSIQKYNQVLRQLKKQNESFELQKTNYTRKIKTEDKDLIFNDKGDEDKKALKLINKVRKDAKEKQNENEKRGVPDNEYERIDFYKLLEIPNDNVSIMKVDINSAYWNLALKEGIISKETDELFKQLYSKNSRKEAKKARLKALGSLATTKEIRTYFNGEQYKDATEFKTEDTKDLYLHICGAVDELMKEAGMKVSGVFYYYWDCLFMNKEFTNQAIEFFENKGFDCKTEEDKIEFVELEGKSFIISTKFDKCYMVREEDKELAKFETNNRKPTTSEQIEKLRAPFFKNDGNPFSKTFG